MRVLVQESSSLSWCRVPRLTFFSFSFFSLPKYRFLIWFWVLPSKFFSKNFQFLPNLFKYSISLKSSSKLHSFIWSRCTKASCQPEEWSEHCRSRRSGRVQRQDRYRYCSRSLSWAHQSIRKWWTDVLDPQRSNDCLWRSIQRSSDCFRRLLVVPTDGCSGQ